MYPQECSTLIRQIHCAMQKNANNELREAGVTFSQFQLLYILVGKPDHQCALKELEKRIGVAQSTVVGIVKRIIEKGFAECIEDTADRRVKLVRITDEGLNVCRAVAKNAHRAEERLLITLSDEERVIITQLLTKVYKAVSQEGTTC